MTIHFERRPVIVEVTTKHVVWVQADTADEALRFAERQPFYELTKVGDTDVATWSSVSLPDGQYDWDEVYEMSYGGSYTGVECDAHVDTHRTELRRREREAKKAACIAAGHPEVETYRSGAVWCVG